MTDTLHRPERLDGETYEQYRKRRARSNAASKELRKAKDPGPLLTEYGPSLFLGQHTNPQRNAGRAQLKAKRQSDNGQHPKLAKTRKRKPHHHALRDQHGSFTLVGSYPRRKWLGGISAKRGF